MTEQELKIAKSIEEKINELNIEIMALFDAKDKKINPFKPFKIKGRIHSDCPEEVEIKLTHTDIRALQDIRSAEKTFLQKLLKEL